MMVDKMVGYVADKIAQIVKRAKTMKMIIIELLSIKKGAQLSPFLIND